MTRFDVPDITITAVALNGVMTCVFPSTNFIRYIHRIQVTASANTPFSVYIGAIALQARKVTNPYGLANGWSPAHETPIPAGAPLYVTFDSLSSGLCSATMQAVGDL